MLIALGMAFALPALTGGTERPVSSASASGQSASALSGTWRSATDEMRLTSVFDESVWGKNAKSIRTVEMMVRPNGDATLTVTRKVIDARGRSVAGSTSIERAELALGSVQNTFGVRSDLAVTVKNADRRYLDEPEATWTLDGLQVSVTRFSDDPGILEVRVDFPDGRGSFWETLRRSPRKTSSP
jgi:hypothetical protein